MSVTLFVAQILNIHIYLSYIMLYSSAILLCCLHRRDDFVDDVVLHLLRLAHVNSSQVGLNLLIVGVLLGQAWKRALVVLANYMRPALPVEGRGPRGGELVLGTIAVIGHSGPRVQLLAKAVLSHIVGCSAEHFHRPCAVHGAECGSLVPNV